MPNQRVKLSYICDPGVLADEVMWVPLTLKYSRLFVGLLDVLPDFAENTIFKTLFRYEFSFEPNSS